MSDVLQILDIRFLPSEMQWDLDVVPVLAIPLGAASAGNLGGSLTSRLAISYIKRIGLTLPRSNKPGFLVVPNIKTIIQFYCLIASREKC